MLRSWSLACVALIACGAPPAAPLVDREPPPVATGAPSEPPPVVPPSERSAEQLRRDEAFMPLATTIVDAYPNHHGWYTPLVAHWSPSGHILYGSGRDGSPQIYAAEPTRPDAPPTALTRGPERATWADFSADGKYVLFLRDTAADEDLHIWRAERDGSGAVDRTPGEALARHELHLPRDRPDTMVYSASNYREPTTPVFVQSVADGPPRRVLLHPRPGFVADVTADGARALFVDILTISEAVLHELDLASGALRRLYPADGRAAGLHGVAYTHDGAGVHLATDEGGEDDVIVNLDLTGEELARYTSPGPRGAVLGVLPAPTGDHLVVLVDAGHHGELRVLDARTLAPRRAIDVPLAELKLGAFRADGREFSLMISRPDHPPDIFAADPATGAVRPLRHDPRPGLDSLPPITATTAETPAFDGLKIPLNVYLPAAPAPRGRPTIVMFHGGPMMSAPVRWDPFIRFYLALGYAVVEPNVRGSTGFGRAYERADNREKRRDWLRDLATVNAWTRAQPWCDPDRVVVWGASYGGYTTLMALSRQPDAWRAGVDLFGPADIARLLRTHHAGVDLSMSTEWGDPDRDPALMVDLSPIHDADKIRAPLFVYAGQHDPRVPRVESDTIVQALRARGVPVEYMVAADEGHSVEKRHNQKELLVRTARFLADALADPPARPEPAR